MSSARGATRRVARLCVSYADAPRLYPRNGVGFAGATIGTRPRFFAQSAVADIDEIGPVTLDFGKLVRPGETPSVAYARLAKEGVLRHDDTQRDAVFVLDDLHRKLVGGHDGDKDKNGKSSSGQSPPQKEGSWFADLFTSTDKPPAPPIPHSGGVYLHGGPGCGKSFVMDLAYACLPGRHGVEKKREHFHSFMLSTHHALHKLGQCKETKARDTVAMYASNIAANASVLCLDEFQVVDVADAMIIRRLLDQLWQKGVTLVTTSNRAPNDLYKNGLNRSQFVPCIEAIMAKCAVHEMRSGRDYRLMGHKNEDLYEDPRDERLRLGASRGACSSSENQNKSSGTWRVFTVGDKDSKERSNQWLTGKLQRFAKNDRMVTVDVSVQGRRIRVNNASGGVARLTFNEICDAALGAGDYTAIASVFHTVGVEQIPRLTMGRVDLMRRFITFIDVLYEHKVKLLATAAETPGELFRRPGVCVAKGGTAGTVNVDEAFAWDRAASRLAEMASREYVEAPWRPKSGAWLLEQAKVQEVVPTSVLRALWMRYDADHNGVLDESELGCLLGDLNEMRRGHRNVPEEQLSSAWEVLTNRGKRGVGNRKGMGTVDSEFDTCDDSGGPAQRKMPSRRGDAFITFDDFIDYGNEAFAACASE